MPAPGEQYNSSNIKNPFEERVVNGFTAIEIATLQSRLNKQLGPEYISQRPGNGGGRVAYLEGNKAIALANEVFGFNGWSSSLGQVQIDYVDENPQNGKVCLGLSIVVRITLKDGTYHEDIGYGSIENGKGKAVSFEKAKKEAATDGLKRALRTFGNVLGNCLYDKTYLKKVQSMKVEPVKFQEDKLHRHPDFAPKMKQEARPVKEEPQEIPAERGPNLRTRTDHLDASMSGEFDDEFDGNLFDGMDISESPGKDCSFDFSLPANGGTVPTPSRIIPGPNIEVAKPGIHTGPKPPNTNHTKPSSGPQARNQPLRPDPPKVQQPQTRPVPVTSSSTLPVTNPPSDHRPPVGFVTSRAAELLQQPDAPTTLNNLPAFNPNAESPIPKEQRTPGLNHAASRPIKRQEVTAPSQAPPNPAPAAGGASGGFNRPGTGPRGNSNFVNPQQDANRRIGMPGAGVSSMNRGQYKPPMKRPPLQDVSNQGTNGGGADSEAKKQKTTCSGAENAGGAVNKVLQGPVFLATPVTPAKRPRDGD